MTGQGGGTTEAKVTYWIWKTYELLGDRVPMNAPLTGASRDFISAGESCKGVSVPMRTGNAYKESREFSGNRQPPSLPMTRAASAPLRWTAMMPDQSQVVGYLEGDPAQTDSASRCVRRAVSSQTNGGRTTALRVRQNDSDNETDPPGDRNSGTG